MLNRYQVSRDGRTAYRRTVEEDCVQEVVRSEKQVHEFVTTSRSNEHIVIIPDGGFGFTTRGRIVRRMSADQRWSSKAVEHISARVKTPVPKNEEIAKPEAGESFVVLDHRHLKTVASPRTRPSETAIAFGKCFKNLGTVVTPGCDAAVGPWREARSQEKT